MEINLNKHVYEGWTIGDFITELEPSVRMIMQNTSWKKPFKTKDELKKWCMENQPYYKKYIPEVVQHFANQFNIN